MHCRDAPLMRVVDTPQRPDVSFALGIKHNIGTGVVPDTFFSGRNTLPARKHLCAYSNLRLGFYLFLRLCQQLMCRRPILLPLVTETRGLEGSKPPELQHEDLCFRLRLCRTNRTIPNEYLQHLFRFYLHSHSRYLKVKMFRRKYAHVPLLDPIANVPKCLPPICDIISSIPRSLS